MGSHYLRYFFVVLLPLTLGASRVGGQETETPPTQPVQQESTSGSDLSPEAVAESLADARKKAEDDYLSLLVKLENDTIVRLKELAKQKAADGDLAAAREAWTQLLILDPNNTEGKEFCEALGVWPQVQKILAKNRSKSPRKNARIEFVCDSGRVFKKLSNGLWSDSHYPPMYQEIDRNEYSVTIVAMTRDANVHVLLPDHFLHATRREWDKGQRFRGEDGQWSR